MEEKKINNCRVGTQEIKNTKTDRNGKKPEPIDNRQHHRLLQPCRRGLHPCNRIRGGDSRSALNITHPSSRLAEMFIRVPGKLM